MITLAIYISKPTFWEERQRPKLQKFNQCWGRRQFNKGNMKVATKREYKIVYKSLKISINNDAIATVLNAAKKV